MGKRKVHLGPGKVRIPGFETVDLRPEVNPDYIADVRDLPFEDCSIDLIYFCHGLEHIPEPEVQTTLREWFRVLKPRGWLYLSVPDFGKIARLYVNRNRNLRGLWPDLMGGQDYPENYHYSLWDRTKLTTALYDAGFDHPQLYDARNFLPANIVDWSVRRKHGECNSLNMKARKFQ